jgi:hypothetical protein
MGDILRTAKLCDCCREVIAAGEPVRWVAAKKRRHKSGSGREFQVTRTVPVHPYDCIQARVDAARAKQLAPLTQEERDAQDARVDRLCAETAGLAKVQP